MRSCPLPVDWLDFLEGTPSDASSSHLEECASCRMVFDTLKHRDLDAESKEQSVAVGGQAGLRWDERQPDHASFGEIWWTASSFEAASVQYKDLDRVPLLVLDVSLEARGPSSVEGAPLWLDWENATSSDLLLEGEDTSTGIPWRVLFRLQTVVERRQLDSCIGALTGRGEKLVRDVLAGRLDEASFGTALESEHDPRLRGDQWIEKIVRTLGHGLATLEEAEDEGLQAQLALEREGLVFELRPTNLAKDAQQAYALAAKEAASGEPVKHARLAKGGQVLEGYLRHDLPTDQLLFEVIQASGFSAPVQVVVTSPRLKGPVHSPPFVPRQGEVVVIASGLAISHFDVTSMELDRSNEPR